jgi:hypothetical protein
LEITVSSRGISTRKNMPVTPTTAAASTTTTIIATVIQFMFINILSQEPNGP